MVRASSKSTRKWPVQLVIVLAVSSYDEETMTENYLARRDLIESIARQKLPQASVPVRIVFDMDVDLITQAIICKTPGRQGKLTLT